MFTKSTQLSVLRHPIAIAFLLLIFAALIGWQRWHTYTEPLDNDVSAYAVMGHELLQGKVLYRDVWEIKPPGTIYSFALAEKLTGYGEQQIFFLAVFVSCLTMLGLYQAGRLAYGSRAGLMAAGCWTIINAALGLEANKPNVEVFMNATLIWLFVGFLALPSKPKLWQLGLLGALAALASLYKQFLLVNAVILLGAHLALKQPKAAEDGRSAGKLLQTLVFGAGFAAVWALVLAGMAALGGLGGFLEILGIVGKTYAGNPLQNLVAGLTKIPPLARNTAFLGPLTALLVLGFGLGFWRGNRRHWGLLLAFVVGTQISVSMPGRFFLHYYQLWLPVLCLGAGWCVGWLNRQPGKLQCIGAPTMAVLTLIILAIPQVRDFRMTPEEWSETKYGTIYREVKGVGLEVKNNLSADQQIYEWGMEAGIYFYSQRQRGSGLDWAMLTPFNTILKQNPRYFEASQRFRQDLEATKPPVLVVNLLLADGENYDWLIQHYRPFPGNNQRGRFALYIRNGSSLERQMYPAG